MAATDPLGSSLNPVVNPKTISWVDPVANAPQIDGTVLPFNKLAEVTSYLIGIRSATKGATSPGTYAIQFSVTDINATSVPLATVQAVLQDDVYAAAIMTVGPQNSVWSGEYFFQVHAPVPVPLPPSGFKLG